MLFLKNGTRRINLMFVKEFEVDTTQGNNLFTIRIIDNADNVTYITVDVLALIKRNDLDYRIDKKYLDEIIDQIKDKTEEDLEQSNYFENIMFSPNLDYDPSKTPVNEIDFEEIVYNNAEDITDRYREKSRG